MKKIYEAYKNYMQLKNERSFLTDFVKTAIKNSTNPYDRGTIKRFIEKQNWQEKEALKEVDCLQDYFCFVDFISESEDLENFYESLMKLV